MIKQTAVWMTVFLMLTGSGCATLQGIVQKPEIQFEDVSMDQMTLFSATPVFKFKMTNPNPVGVAVDSVAYNLTINDRKFINGVADSGIRLPAGGSGVVSVPVMVNFLDLFETFSDLDRSEQIRYALSGDINIGPFKLPFDHQGTFTAPRLPKISLKNVAVSDISLTHARVSLTLGIENDNPFAVKLDGLQYGVKLGGNTFAAGETRTVPQVNENGISTIAIPLELNFFKLGRSVYSLLKEASSGYELTGEMRFDIPKIGEQRIPFRREGKVPVSK